jgi:hypothetical protein
MKDRPDFWANLERLSESEDERPEVQTLWKNLKVALPALQKCLVTTVMNSWIYADGIYRFYHQSFKVLDLQDVTREIVDLLQALLPGKPLNTCFTQIISEGTGKDWEPSMNSRWLLEMRPVIEAFLHAKYFLEMAIESGKTMEKPPNSLPSEWAAVLYLYNLR